MSVVRVANPDLLKTLATEQNQEQPFSLEPIQFDPREPLPIQALDLMIKRGMTTETSDRYNPAIASPFSQSVLSRMRDEQFRLRTLSQFRIRDKKPLTASHKLASTSKKPFFSAPDPIRTKLLKHPFVQSNRPPPPPDNQEPPKLQRLDTQPIESELELYRHRRSSRVSRIFDRKYSRQWKRQYFG